MSPAPPNSVTSRLAQCAWPPLTAPFDQALREATQFVLGEVDPIGIIATGTIIRGEAHANSDLDVYVIHSAAYRRRVQRFFTGVPAEIFINSAPAVRGYFADEHRDGRPLTAHMLATGFVVYSSAAIVDELRREAEEWLVRPSPMSDDQATRERYGIASRLEDGFDVLASDGPAATMLLSQAVTSMLEFFCRSRAGRVPRSKELLSIRRGARHGTGATGNGVLQRRVGSRSSAHRGNVGRPNNRSSWILSVGLGMAVHDDRHDLSRMDRRCRGSSSYRVNGE